MVINLVLAFNTEETWRNTKVSFQASTKKKKNQTRRRLKLSKRGWNEVFVSCRTWQRPDLERERVLKDWWGGGVIGTRNKGAWTQLPSCEPGSEDKSSLKGRGRHSVWDLRNNYAMNTILGKVPSDLVNIEHWKPQPPHMSRCCRLRASVPRRLLSEYCTPVITQQTASNTSPWCHGVPPAFCSGMWTMLALVRVYSGKHERVRNWWGNTWPTAGRSRWINHPSSRPQADNSDVHCARLLRKTGLNSPYPPGWATRNGSWDWFSSLSISLFPGPESKTMRMRADFSSDGVLPFDHGGKKELAQIFQVLKGKKCE